MYDLEQVNSTSFLNVCFLHRIKSREAVQYSSEDSEVRLSGSESQLCHLDWLEHLGQII